MAIPEEHLHRAVEEVLGPAWPRERRRALRRLTYSTVGRLVTGLAVPWGLALVVRVLVGVTVPWVAFAFITVWTALLAIPRPSDRAHLRR